MMVVAAASFGTLGMGSTAAAFTFTPGPGSPLAVGLTPVSVAAGDWNGDGKSDLAVANHYDNTVSVILGTGNGGFGAAPGSSPTVGQRPRSVASGDLSSDAKPDLVVANETDYTVTVLLGDGTGGFSPAPGSPVAVGQRPWHVAVGDLNGDSKLDLAVANSMENSVSVLLGNGAGGLASAPGSPVAVGRSPDGIALGDFNRDGKSDLAVANYGDHNVSVLLGNGTGGFSPGPGSPVAVGGLPSSVAATDLTADGTLDLAVANLADASASVLLGNGSAGFTAGPGTPFALGSFRPVSLAVGDFNNDGRPDLATANAGGSGGVSVLLGDGAGGFSPAGGSPFAAGEGFESVVVGDFDGDSGSDLAVANANDNNVSVLLAPSPSQPPSAAMASSANPVLTRAPVTFDASGSTDPLDRAIVNYEWDLGNGRFDHDTGAMPTVTTKYTAAGVVHPRVRVTNAAGGTAIETLALDVRRAPPPGEIGVSINDGDFATNTKEVRLSLVWPAFAAKARISNDGGFNSAGGTSTVPVAPTVDWTLRSERNERLPVTVYVRFPGTADAARPFTDDIVLDTTVPVIQRATFVGRRRTAGSTRVRGRVFRVRVLASERRSGISQAQFSRRRSKGTSVRLVGRRRRGIRRLNRVVGVKAAERPRYVRVRSAAGTWSSWRAVE